LGELQLPTVAAAAAAAAAAVWGRAPEAETGLCIGDDLAADAGRAAAAAAAAAGDVKLLVFGVVL
jgi:hypothetical protein